MTNSVPSPSEKACGVTFRSRQRQNEAYTDTFWSWQLRNGACKLRNGALRGNFCKPAAPKRSLQAPKKRSTAEDPTGSKTELVGLYVVQLFLFTWLQHWRVFLYVHICEKRIRHYFSHDVSHSFSGFRICSSLQCLSSIAVNFALDLMECFWGHIHEVKITRML